MKAIMDIRKIAEQAVNEPYYFSDKTMKAFGQKFEDFTVEEHGDEFLFYAPAVDRVYNVKAWSKRIYDPVSRKIRFLTPEENADFERRMR